MILVMSTAFIFRLVDFSVDPDRVLAYIHIIKNGDDDMLTFANIDLNKEAHTNAMEQGMVLGFATFNFDEGKETLFAVKPDKTFWTTGERERLPTFRNKKWTKVETIPNEAEFIGHYYLMK